MTGEVLELRVHGVSNTPPAALLGLEPAAGADRVPPPRRVAGDPVTGFYRAADRRPDRPPDGTPAEPVVEAYSWGQLTSGTRTTGARATTDLQRALWTLLLPFSLANVALHARPDIPADPAREPWHRRPGLAAWLVRVFCLSLTATFVLAAAGVGVDLVAWQCVDTACLDRVPGSWDFLAGAQWRGTSRPLAVGLALPVAALLVLWLIARRSFRYERALPDGTAPATDQPLENPLQRPEFWQGADQVRRLGTLHLAVGLAAAAAVPVAAVLLAGEELGYRRSAGWSILAAFAAAALLAVAAVAHPAVARRNPAAARMLVLRPGVLLALVVAGLAGTVALLLSGAPLDPDSYPPMNCAELPEQAGCGQDRSLPGYDAAIGWLGAGQLALLLALAGIGRTGRWTLVVPVAAAAALVWGYGVDGRWTGDWRPAALTAGLAVAAVLVLPRSRGHGDPPADRYARVAWGGRAPAVLAGLGWALGLVYAAGVLYGAADRLNAGATPTGISAIRPPVPLLWGGIGLAVAIAVMVAAGLVVYLTILRRYRRDCLAEILADRWYAPDGGQRLSSQERQRVTAVAGAYAVHRLVERAGTRTVGVLVLLATAVAAAGIAGALAGLPQVPVTDPDPPPDPGWWQQYALPVLKWTIDVGSSLGALLPLLIAGIGFLVYRNETFRRYFGVVWDIATFWPRAAHPFGPPCYADLVVPQLQTRAAGLLCLPDGHSRRVDGLILAGHSQGAVICVATVLQLPESIRSRIWLLTYGCQLNRVYGRVFPAYFGPAGLATVSRALTAGGPTGDAHPPRWTNLWRETDPLGYPVKADSDLPLDEVRLNDPVVPDRPLRVPGDDVLPPPLRGHSDYPADPAYLAKRNQAAEQLSAHRAG